MAMGSVMLNDTAQGQDLWATVGYCSESSWYLVAVHLMAVGMEDCRSPPCWCVEGVIIIQPDP